MVFVAEWSEFAEHAETLIRAKPDKVRCTLKYRPSDKQVEFKVTDDAQCFQFRTDQQQHVKYFTRLNTKLMKIVTRTENAPSS